MNSDPRPSSASTKQTAQSAIPPEIETALTEVYHAGLSAVFWLIMIMLVVCGAIFLVVLPFAIIMVVIETIVDFFSK